MKNVRFKKAPSVLLIIILIGFPQISESIFTPSLPDLASVFGVSNQTIQLTMSSYFIAFAFGVLYFGGLSDRVGRKKGMLLGIFTYLLGNVGLLLASDFYMLILARSIQAFGASAGSVITQAIMRESFEEIKGAKVFAKVGAAMSLSPALGPLIGGTAQTYYGYKSVFWLLIVMAASVLLYCAISLPEAPFQVCHKVNYFKVTKMLLSDRNVLTYGFLIGGINGILFSYYSEAPFIFINYFKMQAVHYGWLGLLLGVSSILGAVLSTKWLIKNTSNQIISRGLFISFVFSIVLLLASILASFNLMLIAIFGMFLGINTALPNVLNIALQGYEEIMGIASGIFSFGYYVLVSLFTYLMSCIHNDNITTLPIYILMIVIAMLCLYLKNQYHFNKSRH